MLDQAILDFIVTQLLLNAVPVVVLVAIVLEIVKTIAERYDKEQIFKPFLPLIALIIGCISPLLLNFIFSEYSLMTRIVYGGIVGCLTNGLYDQIKGIFKIKDYFGGVSNGKSE